MKSEWDNKDSLGGQQRSLAVMGNRKAYVIEESVKGRRVVACLICKGLMPEYGGLLMEMS